MLSNQEYKLNLNGINHWVKIGGAENNTVPLVIIHGGPGGHNYVFEHTIGKRLEEHYTVIYYEQRGCGRSDSPSDDLDYRMDTLLSDLYELCISLKLQKIIPLGYSFGGEIALRFASKYPHLIDKIIVQSPSMISDADFTAKTQLKGFISVGTDSEIKRFESIDTEKIHGAELMNYIWDNSSPTTQSKFMFHDLGNAQKMYDLWTEAWDKHRLMNTGKMADVVMNEDNQVDGLILCKNINSETLIIIGEHDRNCGIELAESYHQSIPSSILVIVPKAAHFADFEQEDIFFETVCDFLNT